ncbi:MAG: argininosuccinate lyase [Spirochaetae bacterium HGW-Spirochaetae-9]|nr:MAG: argininosuccinate lyase [Spirochaetae bacterium HGW-Spirochaetae-9]
MSGGAFAPVYVDRVLDPAYRNWKSLYEGDALRVHRAHLCMLEERGILPDGVAKALKAGIEAAESGFVAPEHIPEGVEDLYFLFEKELGRIAGEENAAWLHTARSRNDMDTTVFRLALKRVMIGFLRSLEACCRRLLERCRQGEGELTVLYTHGQPANPSTTAHYLSALLLDLLEDARGLSEALADVDQSTLGACAITGTGFPIDRERVAELLGMDGFVVNSYQAIATSHWLTKPAQALRILMQDLGRFAADLSHKASCEVGLYDFPDDLVQISSIMPQKRNPVIIEHLRIQAGQAAGLCAAIEELYRNVPYQDVNEAADAPVSQFMQAFDFAASALDLAGATFEGMRARPERARAVALDFGVTTTELADEIVRRFGIGFRAAHGICAAFIHSGRDKATLRRSFSEKTGRELPWSDAEIDAILEPEHFVEVRKTAGGPAREGMVPVYKMAEVELGALAASLGALDNRQARADQLSAQAWAAL